MIIVGECRDKEVICAAIEAARTGHITSTTFHAANVAGTMNRLLYHLDNDRNLSLDLILQLNIILSQKMLKQDGKYLVDTQYLLFTPQVRKILSDTLKAGGDVSEAIANLIADPNMQAQGVAKTWDYGYLHGEA
jgi:Tfp pilus assembly pilus retraction ATPase PilT